MRARRSLGLALALVSLPTVLILAGTSGTPASAASQGRTDVVRFLDLTPTGSYVSVRDGLPEGQGVAARPGGTVTVTAPRHVGLERLDLELIVFTAAGDTTYTPAQLHQSRADAGGSLTVTVPESLARTPVQEAYLAPTEDSVPVFDEGWHKLTGEFSFISLKLSHDAPAQARHALVSRLFLETQELSGQRVLSPGQKVRASIPEGDPVLSLLGRISLRAARIELSPFTDHAGAKEDDLGVRTSSDGLSVTFTVPRSFPAGDSSLGIVATRLADPTIEALQWTTRTSVSRRGPAARVGVARVLPGGTMAFHLADTDRDGGGRVHVVEFGRAGDVPLAGDWDGDGHDGIGVWRAAEHAFYLRSGDGAKAVTRRVSLGASDDLPVVGKFGKDAARTTVGVYQPRTGTFLLAGSSRDGGGKVRTTRITRPAPGAVTPLAGDWDGDGTTTIGVHRRGSGAFQLLGGPDVLTVDLGEPHDTPLVGDWNGDGFTEVAIRRAGTGEFVLGGPNLEGGTPTTKFTFGRPGDLPFAWTP